MKKEPRGNRRKILWSLCQPVLTYPGDVLWDRVGK
jgi:hypothetical protein